MALQWDDLRIFLAVARAESISGAGRSLKLDPATVGRRIQRLEASLAGPLFAKSPQGYALTEAGQRLVAHAEQAEQAVLQADSMAENHAGTLSGQVRIGAPDGCANYLLPQVCGAIIEQNPDLELQIVALPRVFNLSKREADMAIAVSPPLSGRQTVKKIAEYQLHLAASEHYLAQHPSVGAVEDLSQHKIVGYIPDLIFDKELDYLPNLGVTHASLTSNSVSVQFNLIRQGGGIGVVHKFAMPSAPEICPVLTDQFKLTRSFYLIRHADDKNVTRFNRVADALIIGIRNEIKRLETATG